MFIKKRYISDAKISVIYVDKPCNGDYPTNEH